MDLMNAMVTTKIHMLTMEYKKSKEDSQTLLDSEYITLAKYFEYIDMVRSL